MMARLIQILIIGLMAFGVIYMAINISDLVQFGFVWVVLTAVFIILAEL